MEVIVRLLRIYFVWFLVTRCVGISEVYCFRRGIFFERLKEYGDVHFDDLMRVVVVVAMLKRSISNARLSHPQLRIELMAFRVLKSSAVKARIICNMGIVGFRRMIVSCFKLQNIFFKQKTNKTLKIVEIFYI